MNERILVVDDAATTLEMVRRNLEGLLSRPVYYQLAEIAEPAPDGNGHGVASGGIFHRFG